MTGQDAELSAVQRIHRGTQAMTIYKPVSRLAARAARKAVTMAKGKVIIAHGAVNDGFKEVPSLLEEVVVENRTNLLETVVKNGFHRAEDLKQRNRCTPPR